MAKPVVYEIVGGVYKNATNRDEFISTFLVDPNPADGDTHLQEDLFIYVELVAKPKSRSIIQSQTNDRGEFLSTGVDYNKPISFITTTSQSGKEYHTTNYMNIDGVTSSVEGFGITNIDINIGADFTPQVSIEFFDIKGSSFREFDDYGGSIFSDNPLSAFFKLPYPVFELTVKGFYGRAVKYCLNLMKWDATFDANSGGFKIKADFIGYTFAFLADIPLKHIWAISQTPQGRQKISEQGVIPFSDMLSKFGQLTRLTEEFKSDNTSFLKLKNINLAISKLATIINKTGVKINEENQSLFTSYISENNIIKNVDQVFIRDVGILTISTFNNYTFFVKEITSLIDEYNSIIENSINENFYIRGYGIPSIGDFYDYDSLIPALKTKIENNEPYNTDTITVESISKKFPLNTGIGVNNFYYLVDFYSLRHKLSELMDKLKQRKKKQENEAKETLNEIAIDKLGFNPTVENVFSVICGNIDAYLDILYDYSMKASSDQIKEDRLKNLNSFSTDIQFSDNFTEIIYPFPDVINSNDEKIWIGDSPAINKNAFPEIELVDLIINGLNKIYTEEELQRTKDKLKSQIQREVDTHFPFNLLDYGSIDYNELNFISDDTITENSIVIDSILNRLYSIVYVGNEKNKNNINVFAKIDANNFFNNIKSDMVLMNFDSVTDFGNAIFEFALNSGILVENNLGLYDKTNITINDINLKTKDITIVSENKNLYENVISNEVQLDERMGELFNSLVVDDKYNSFYNENYIIAKDYSYQFFESPIPDRIINDINGNPTLSKSIYNGNVVKNDLYDFIVIENLSSLIFLEGKNNANTGNDILDTNRGVLLDTLVTDVYDKYFSLLIDFGFKKNINEFFEIISNYSGIIYTSKHYLSFLGGYFYNLNKNTFDNDYKVKSIELNYNISESIKNKLINYFKKNAENVGQFLNENIKTYIRLSKVKTETDIDYQFLKTAYNNIKNELTKSETLLIENSQNIFSIQNASNLLTRNQIIQYLNVFHQEFKSLYNQKTKTTTTVETSSVDPIMNDPDFKLDVYESLKAVYDKWLSYGSESGKIYNACFSGEIKSESGNRKKRLLDYFHFIDRTWSDIGDKAVINPKILMNLSSNNSETTYGFITKILNDSKFLIYFAPSFIANRTINDLEVMFTPQPTISNASGGANMIAVYTGGNSKNLRISNSDFKNDGFNFLNQSIYPKKFGERKVPRRLMDNEEEKAKYNISCFLVEYAKDNQQHFQSVNVSSEEHYNTSEYLQVYSDLVDRGSSLKRFYKGIDIYNLYKIRSYKASVSGLGNMQIQPMNYFQLNIPLFQGVYLITKVKHSFEVNFATTSFEGYRMPAYTYPIVTDVTSYIKLPDNIFDLITEGSLSLINEPDVIEDSDGTDVNSTISQDILIAGANSNNTLFEITVIK